MAAGVFLVFFSAGGARAYGQDVGSLAGHWRILSGPDGDVQGDILFSDRQFDGSAGCGRFWGDYRRSGGGFSTERPSLDGDCPMEAEILRRLSQIERAIRRGPMVDLLDAWGRALLSLIPR